MRCLQPEGIKQQTMYRYCVDNAVTYTSEDFVLFRESPFACWMERLTLENPDHGIPPDVGSAAPANYMERQDDLADTLRAEGKNIYTVDWGAEEPVRRTETLEAMRRGVDFIVNGQLALGPLSGSSNLLMRTSGYSELGNYLYIPCDTQAKTTLNSAFRLCFLADLLHSLQGQLPPQMLIIRGGSDLLPLQTEDHIYHYRAVKQRFMETMRSFRKHRMPDPAESSHFGRWSDCANEVLKQRALRGENSMPAPEAPAGFDSPMPQAVTAAAPVAPGPIAVQAQQSRYLGSKGLAVSGTLADQAKMLHSGEGPSQPESRSRIPDAALLDLEFIGRGAVSPGPSPSPKPQAQPEPTAEPQPKPEAEPQPEPQPEPQFAVTPHPLDSTGFPESTVIDRDEPVHPAVPPPVLNTDSTEFEVDCIDDSDYQLPAGTILDPPPASAIEPNSELSPPEQPPVQLFSSSLNTSGEDRD